MRRKRTAAALAALTLVLTACGGGPGSYKLRADLCEVLDYQAFSSWFGALRTENHSATDAKVDCTARGAEKVVVSVVTTVEAYKYGSAEEAKQVFNRTAREKSDMDAKLAADVDDARFYQGYSIVVLDADLLLKVRVRPEATDDSSFKAEMPRLIAGLTDQVLDRLREKS